MPSEGALRGDLGLAGLGPSLLTMGLCELRMSTPKTRACQLLTKRSSNIIRGSLASCPDTWGTKSDPGPGNNAFGQKQMGGTFPAAPAPAQFGTTSNLIFLCSLGAQIAHLLSAPEQDSGCRSPKCHQQRLPLNNDCSSKTFVPPIQESTSDGSNTPLG